MSDFAENRKDSALQDRRMSQLAVIHRMQRSIQTSEARIAMKMTRSRHFKCTSIPAREARLPKDRSEFILH